MNIERYEKAIMAALAVQQKRIELREKLKIIAENLTAAEVMTRTFDNDSASRAIKLLEDKLGLKKEKYVKGSVNFEDVEIYLHENIDADGWRFLKPIFSEISNKAILGI